jgi:tyrosyl-tRNA synthetase
MTFNEELTWRGLVNQTTYKDLGVLDNQPVTFYWGVDPSADSMTIGNLAAAMLVKCFIKYGHKPVLLVGGATGLIGDPDGKSSERKPVSRDEIESNKQALGEEYKRIFEGSEFKLVDNYDWFKDINYLDFLRDVGKHVPMRQMLGRDFVETRLSENGAGISYSEFSYVLIQAYDFLHLYKDHNVSLQVCGSDQWGNSIAGVDLIRRTEGAEANVFSTPLVIDETTGRKFGKSEAGAVWLDPNKTSPTQFYQFWINLPDNNIDKYLKIYTEYDPTRIAQIMEAHSQSLGTRYAQTELANSVTKLVHGEEATAVAEEITDILTGKQKLTQATSSDLIDSLRREITSVKVNSNVEMADLLVDSGLATSKTEARRLVNGNAISINGEKYIYEFVGPSDFKSPHVLVRRGKAFRDSALVEFV